MQTIIVFWMLTVYLEMVNGCCKGSSKARNVSDSAIKKASEKIPDALKIQTNYYNYTKLIQKYSILRYRYRPERVRHWRVRSGLGFPAISGSTS